MPPAIIHAVDVLGAAASSNSSPEQQEEQPDSTAASNALDLCIVAMGKVCENVFSVCFELTLCCCCSCCREGKARAFRTLQSRP